MNISVLAENFLSAPILFFFLGLIAVIVKSDMEIPAVLSKFFSLYLLFDIGIKGGEELYRSGLNSGVLVDLSFCILMAVATPILSFWVLRRKLDVYNAGAIAAAYGSVSAVTFATSVSFLQGQNVAFGGHMVAAMALMESPAIIVGLIIIRMMVSSSGKQTREGFFGLTGPELKKSLHESFFNGSILLLTGSLIIGFAIGHKGEQELKPFVSDIYKGMLCFYLLDMGLLAGSKMSNLKKSGVFLVSFAILMPVFNACLAMVISGLIGMSLGNALLFTMLSASASYIAVPAAMRIAVPEANMSLMLPMSLGVTFTFNIAIGIPVYYSILQVIR